MARAADEEMRGLVADCGCNSEDAKPDRKRRCKGVSRSSRLPACAWDVGSTSSSIAATAATRIDQPKVALIDFPPRRKVIDGADAPAHGHTVRLASERERAAGSRGANPLSGCKPASGKLVRGL